MSVKVECEICSDEGEFDSLDDARAHGWSFGPGAEDDPAANGQIIGDCGDHGDGDDDEDEDEDEDY